MYYPKGVCCKNLDRRFIRYGGAATFFCGHDNKWYCLSKYMSRKKLSGGTLGERLKSFRLSNDLNQQEFAASLGISKAYLSNLESNKKTEPSDALLMLIELRYGLRKNWLLTGKGIKSVKGIMELSAGESKVISLLRKGKNELIPDVHEIIKKYQKLSKKDRALLNGIIDLAMRKK